MDLMTLGFDNPTTVLELLVSIALGIALSASCGFRVFLPPLVISMAGLFFNVPLPEAMSWLATTSAFWIFLTAALVEVGAYYFPWLDNALDTITTPAAVTAGTILTSAFMGDYLDPTLKWTIALIAGGGAAGTVQAATVTSRAASSAMSLGLTNPVLATIENVLAVVLSVSTFVLPVLAIGIGVVVIGLVAFVLYKIRPKSEGLDIQPESELEPT